VESNEAPHGLLYTVEWVLGGKTRNMLREELVHTTAEKEGMVQTTVLSSFKRKRAIPDTNSPTALDAADEKEVDEENEFYLHAPPSLRKRPSRGLETETEIPVLESVVPSTTSSTKKGAAPKSKAAAPSTTPPTKKKGALPKSKPSAKSAGKKRQRPQSPPTLETDAPVRKKAPPAATKKTKVTAKATKSSKSGTLQSGARSKPASASSTTAAPVRDATASKVPVGEDSSAVPDDEQVARTAYKNAVAAATSMSGVHGISMFERHHREFERLLTRIERIGPLEHFWGEDVPDEFDEDYENDDAEEKAQEEQLAVETQANTVAAGPPPKKHPRSSTETGRRTSTEEDESPSTCNPMRTIPATRRRIQFPSHPPYNWEMIHRRREQGRYILDREFQEQEDRFRQLAPYYNSLEMWQRPEKVDYSTSVAISSLASKSHDNADNFIAGDPLCNRRVYHKIGIDWDTFRDDVVAMCDAAIERDRRESGGNNDSEAMASSKVQTLSKTALKIKEVRSCCSQQDFRVCLKPNAYVAFLRSVLAFVAHFGENCQKAKS
jgi:hypothetical protein